MKSTMKNVFILCAFILELNLIFSVNSFPHHNDQHKNITINYTIEDKKIDKREIITLATAAAVAGLVSAGVSIGRAATGEPCREFGCHKGNCWAWCGMTTRKSEWCYTTTAHSQSYKYQPCSSSSDCNGCWSCAGPCTL